MRAGWRLLSIGIVVLSGCRRDMYDQPHLTTFEASTFFDNGTSARHPVDGTVARGEWAAHQLYDVQFVPGVTTEDHPEGVATDEFPFPVDDAIMRRGQDRYRIYCTPCHGELGDGRGMIVQRGFSPPPSYHSKTIREQPVGHYVDVITRGHGVMYSYAARVAPADRWAIAAYIRALQYSQGRSIDDLTEADRAAVLAVEDH
jgi:mono/diheme cytochrome c family protein